MNICLQFPESMRSLNVVCIWVIDFHFFSTIGVKKVCPLSLILFGLWIDELEEIVAKFIKEEGIEKVSIGNVVIMLLLYAYDVVPFANMMHILS